MIRLPLWILYWLVQVAIKVPFVLLGLIVHRGMFYDRYTHINALPKWKRLFANPEAWHGGHLGYEGSLPSWWRKRMEMEGRSQYYAYYRYHAIRNPADGLRNIKWLQLWIEKDKVKYYTPKYLRYYEPWYMDKPGVYWYIAWQGNYAGLKVLWVEEEKFTEFKWGFRVEPRDAEEEIAEDSTRKHFGASFASKLRWRRPFK